MNEYKNSKSRKLQESISKSMNDDLLISNDQSGQPSVENDKRSSVFLKANPSPNAATATKAPDVFRNCLRVERIMNISLCVYS